MSKAIILPIKGTYVRKILNGKKKFEFRKRLCKENISHIYIYETAPIKKVVGSVEVKAKLLYPKDDLWNYTKDYAGIEKTYFDTYFSNQDYACAYELGKIKVFSPAKELKDYGVNFTPQSYVYIDN